ncbi:conserved protein of unknown function [Rhodovastum atsumiense]|uniref:KfrA N-terminal DNA-binding domain-containing protein n=1 Tax=Rhodovastum atsumiense TaxID=504468 RepID=A0A5M6IPS8_9PROT|nr:hypothetical protein [Rhodovastum atsumiense]KAA5610261.1 hypothetical protein F1189_19975 [Rhodovastum atsumiense]CAH2602254.1 conserved protein of unknown function [Rhodovastum atsumiense]
MMQLAEITRAEVLDAGQRLLGEGKKVNGWSLRRAIGDRGKPELLMAEWEQARSEGLAESAGPAEGTAIVLPPGIAEAMEQARLELVARFDGLLFSLVRSSEESLKARYKDDFDRLAAERAQMAEDLASASASIEATEARLAEALAETAALRAQLAVQASEAEAQIIALEAQARQFGAAAVAAQQARATAEAGTVAAQREVELMWEHVARLEAALAAAISEMEAQRTRAGGELAQARAELATATGRATAAEAASAEARAVATEANEEMLRRAQEKRPGQHGGARRA